MIYDLEETVGAASPVDLGDDAELVRRGEVDEGDVAVGGHLGEARPVGLGPGIALREGVVARNSGKKLVRRSFDCYKCMLLLPNLPQQNLKVSGKATDCCLY